MINPLLWWDLRLLTAPKVRPLKTNSGHRRDIVGPVGIEPTTEGF